VLSSPGPPPALYPLAPLDDHSQAGKRNLPVYRYILPVPGQNKRLIQKIMMKKENFKFINPMSRYRSIRYRYLECSTEKKFKFSTVTGTMNQSCFC
jgi:hypothetical protein